MNNPNKANICGFGKMTGGSICCMIFILLFFLFFVQMEFYYCLQFEFNFTLETKSFHFDLPQAILTEFPQFDLKNVEIINRNSPNFPLYRTYLHEREFDQSKQPLVYTGNDFQPDLCISTFVHAAFYEGIDVLYINNGYVGDIQIVGTKEYYIDMYNFTGWYNPYDIQRDNNFKTTKGFRYVLAPISRWIDYFGHWIDDTVCPMLFIEDWIWDLNPVLCIARNNKELVREYLNIIGHGNIEVVNYYKEMIYAEHLFVVKAFGHENPCGHISLPLLREKASNYYGTKGIKPEIYAYANKQNTNRKITNLQTLIDEISKQYSIEFKLIKVNFPNREQFAKTMASVKLLVCPSGSLAFNILFMSEGTGFLTLNSMMIDGPNIKIASDLSIWHVEIINPKMGHYRSPGPTNITRSLIGFKVIKSAVENGKWPENNLFSPYNGEYMRKQMGPKINMTLLLKDVIPGEYELYKKSVDFSSI